MGFKANIRTVRDNKTSVITDGAMIQVTIYHETFELKAEDGMAKHHSKKILSFLADDVDGLTMSHSIGDSVERPRDEVDRLKKVIVGMAKELGIQDVALAASKRKLDAANELLQDKDGIIADLRDRQEEILGEDAEYFEELEACNKRQKDLLEESRAKLEILYATLC